jgi:hypothetical protein
MTALIRVWADFVVAHRLAIIVMTVLLLPLILLTGRAVPSITAQPVTSLTETLRL